MKNVEHRLWFVPTRYVTCITMGRWCRHQMENFPRYWPFTGHRWSPRTKASDAELWCFLLISAWISVWVNNREAGDLRRHRTQNDVIVMCRMHNYGASNVAYRKSDLQIPRAPWSDKCIWTKRISPYTFISTTEASRSNILFVGYISCRILMG